MPVTRRPDPAQVSLEIVPVLVDLLRDTDDRDILCGALLALGRSAEAGDADVVAGEAARLLEHRETSVQTSATLTLGMLARETDRTLLEDLLYCRTEGHRAVGASSVPWRVRSAAALSLGLLGGPESVATLTDFIDRQGDADTDALVCSMLALGLSARDAGDATDRAFDYLVDLLGARGLSELERSFVPTALAKLGDERALTHLAALVRDQQADNRVTQAAALALGSLGTMTDAVAVEALMEGTTDGRDIATRNFCLLGLARLAGRDDDPVAHADRHAEILDMYTQEILKPKRAGNRSWSALGGALYARAQLGARAAMVECLAKAYGKERDPAFKGADAIALGMLNARSEAPRIHEDLKQFGDVDFQGYAAVALGLMNYREAAPTLRELCLDKAVPEELRLQAARGLGLMGDESVVRDMAAMLDGGGTTTTRISVAQSLGASSDKQAIPHLKALALDDSLPENTRAAACLALGLLGERSGLPWNAVFKTDRNYLASTPMLDFVATLL